MAQGLSGVNLGRYRVLELVGQGGMASVYRAEDPRLFRQVAIKVPHAHLAADPDFSARFLREAQAVAALRHPNIVQVFDFGEEGATAFMVMELIEGPTLAAMLAELTGRAAFMSPTDVVALGSAIGSAIDYAAARGMIHRDIKPSNIIMDGGRRPVLTDYGIARVLGATSHTVPGIVVGSAHYMSPEQAQGLPLDARSDLYSLAVVLFEALTGRVPFGGETTMTVLMQHMTTPPPPVRSYNRLLPAGFDPTWARALAKDPAHRYQNGAELGGALHAALAEVAQAPDQSGGARKHPGCRLRTHSHRSSRSDGRTTRCNSNRAGQSGYHAGCAPRCRYHSWATCAGPAPAAGVGHDWGGTGCDWRLDHGGGLGDAQWRNVHRGLQHEKPRHHALIAN